MEEMGESGNPAWRTSAYSRGIRYAELIMKRGIGWISALLLCSLVMLALTPARAAAAPPTVTGFWVSSSNNNVVFVFGSEFDTVPGATQVNINGINAPISQLLATDLLFFILPAGDTNGFICVTTPQGSGCSDSKFGTVLPGVAITGLWPGQGQVNKLVFVFGAGFDPNPGMTQVSLAGTSVSILQVIDSKLLFFLVPAGAVSGPVTVTTPLGAATSAASFIVPAPSGKVEYIYDELGRLTGVIDSSGQSARYIYDALGNVTAIERHGAGTVTILEFTPNSGATGTSVTIDGAGFSATASQNTVKFNGTTATVTSATATQLAVTVPVGATTGQITVTTSAGTATSAADFVVTAAGLGAPTIAGFTPTTGVMGTAVTITGANFDPALGASRVSFNQVLSNSVTGVTPTSLTAVVPANTRSGKLQVITPNGTATSSQDFIIPPANINPADIIANNRIDVGGAAQTLDINVANKAGVLLFEGTQGSYLTLDLTAFTVSPSSGLVTYEIYRPNGVLLTSGNVSATKRSIHIPPLPQGGTYSIYFKPGNATLSMTVSLQVDSSTIVIDGPLLNKSLNFTGQSTRLLFNATVNQILGLRIGALTLSPSSSFYVTVTVYRPDSTAWTSITCPTSTNGCDLNLADVPATGIFTIVVEPWQGGVGTFTAALSPGLVTVLVPDAAPRTVNITQAGQKALLIFNATEGQSLRFGFDGLSLSPSSSTSATVTVFRPVYYDPNGVYLTSIPCSVSNGGCGLALQNLTTSGTYKIEVAPAANATGSFTAMISSDLVAPLVVDGPPSTVSIVRRGQAARLMFNATAGQNLGLGISALTLTPSTTTSASVAVYKPDGTSLASTTCSVANGGCGFRFTNLPITGTYTVLVTPSSGATGSFTATLSSDVTGTLSLNTPLSVSLRAGQNARPTFTGNAGDNLGLALNAVAISGSNSNGTAYVYKPDGTQLTSLSFGNGTAIVDLPTLPVTGTYTVLIDPPYAASATLSVLLTADVMVPLNLDGAASNVTIAQTGQTARLGFSASAGQNLGLGISALTLTPSTSTSATVTVYRPNGTSLTSITCSVSSGVCALSLANLAVTGAYSVVVTPVSGATGSFTATLSSDLLVPLTLDGAASNVNITRVGQNARLTYSGTTGQALGLSIKNLILSPSSSTDATVTVYKPDGTTLNTAMSCAVTSGGCSIPLLTLPVSGTYNIVVSPSSGATGSFMATLLSDVSTSLVLDGPTSSLTTTRAYQGARFTFSGTAGQNLGLEVKVTMPAIVNVYQPNGTLYATLSCSTLLASTCVTDFFLSGLPASGAYSIRVEPASATTGNATAILSSDITGTLTAATPFNLAIGRAGQNARLTFSATAGQNRILTFASIATTPTRVPVYFTVYRPDGYTTVASTSTTGTSTTLNLTSLPVTGTYSLLINPLISSNTTMTVTLSP